MPYKDPVKRAKKATARKRTKRAALVDLMGGHCRLCLTQGPPCLFDFHHVDPSTKVFGMEQNKFSRSWPRLLAEADKCILLCANCHRELHAS